MRKAFFAAVMLLVLVAPSLWAKVGFQAGYSSAAFENDSEGMVAFGVGLDGTFGEVHMVHGAIGMEAGGDLTGAYAELGYRYGVSEKLFIGPLVQSSTLAHNTYDNYTWKGTFYGADLLWQFGEEFGLLAKYTTGEYDHEQEYIILNQKFKYTDTQSADRLFVGLTRRF